MGEKPDQIEQQLNRTREDLSDNINELQEKVRTAFDWRTQFEARPITMMAVAFGGGILLSALLPTIRSKPRYRDTNGASHKPETQAHHAAPEPASGPAHKTNGKHTPAPSEALHALKVALVGVAATKLGGVAGDLLTGFKEELSKGRLHKEFDPSSSRAT